MPAFFVALRESVHDPKEMRLYADKAAGGWVGILLDQIADDALESHLREARRIIASKRKPARKPRGM